MKETTVNFSWKHFWAELLPCISGHILNLINNQKINQFNYQYLILCSFFFLQLTLDEEKHLNSVMAAARGFWRKN